MSSEWGQLAREIFAADNYYAPDPYEEWDKASTAHREYAYTIADGLMANGYGHIPTALHQAADEADTHAVACPEECDRPSCAQNNRITATWLRDRADRAGGTA